MWQHGSSNSTAAVVAAAARWQHSAWQEGLQRQAWQRGGGVWLGGAAAAWPHWGMTVPAATNAVLPLRAAAVAMKTPAVTAMTGAQTINNQLKARKR